MRGLIRTAVLVARAWGGGAVLVACAVTVVAWRVVPGRPVEVPGREGIRWVVWPLLPILPTVAIGAAPVDRVLERAAPIPRVAPAFGFLSMLVGGTALSALASSGFDSQMVVRNHLMLVGLALLVGAFAPPFAWMPGFAAGVVMWMLGTGPAWVAPWALLFAPSGDQRAAAAALTLAVIGSLTFALRGAYGRWR